MYIIHMGLMWLIATPRLDIYLQAGELRTHTFVSHAEGERERERERKREREREGGREGGMDGENAFLPKPTWTDWAFACLGLSPGSPQLGGIAVRRRRARAKECVYDNP